jgi:hypothetical protein
LETLEEFQALSDEDLAFRASLQKELLDLYEADDIFWYSRSSEHWLLKGDNKTEFSHRLANGKKRRNTIFRLKRR